MAVHFVYYHHSRLHQEKTFSDDYWQHLLHISDIDYLTNMMYALEYALKTEDYCLSTVKSPHLNRYPNKDIRLFFEKFYDYLKENLMNKLENTDIISYKTNLDNIESIIEWLVPFILNIKVSTKIKITSLLVELHQNATNHERFEGIIDNDKFKFKLLSENDETLNSLLKRISVIRNTYSAREIKDKRIALMTCENIKELKFYKMASDLNSLKAELDLSKKEISIDLV